MVKSIELYKYYSLGEPGRATNHYKLTKNEASSNEISKVKIVQVLIGKCSEAS
ncbi:hypothetical protein KSP40_PGU019194 [Platanthera guangdongensis]|uniref:Uncharacterized protein n=1 Tax=Platanthera guangdongensis TaxID=2320717 RepID=A0ABR2MDN0_9ASPA